MMYWFKKIKRKERGKRSSTGVFQVRSHSRLNQGKLSGR